MTIVKKLFLITITSLGVNLHINTSEPQAANEQKFFTFINRLKDFKDAAAINLANWMESIYATNQDLSDQLINIVNTDAPVANKTQAISKLKNQTELEEAEKNKSYFANISTRMKAAALFIIGASIASYFYFMRPWSTPTIEQ